MTATTCSPLARRRRYTLPFTPRIEALEPRLALAAAVGLTPTNSLIRFDTATPATHTAELPVGGLVAGDSLVAIDFRPVTGQLYALGVNGTTAHLYTIGITGFATQLGGDISLPESGGVSGAETSFGFDFNPVVDRIRVVANNRDNFRLNPTTGALTAVDVALNPGTPVVVGAAYTNNVPGATSTTLYVIDSATDQLLIQGAGPGGPNAGTLTPVGPLGVDTSDDVGFDIATLGGTNQAFAALQASGTYGFYSINLATGAATLVGNFGGSTKILGLAIVAAQSDFGDAPDSYGTLVASDGPRHLVSAGPFLGTAPDLELDGLASADATGDDTTGIDDEDGVFLPATLIAGLTAAATVSASADGRLDAWIDFNGDGSFAADEQIAVGLSVVPGDNTVLFTVPVGAVATATFARFRISSAGGLGPTGVASDGEVEDYQVQVAAPLRGTAIIVGDMLVVTGTARSDVILVEPRPINPAQLRVKLNGHLLAIFNRSDVQRIGVVGLAGNDTIVVNASLDVPSELHGNAGSDHLFGARSVDLLFGESGNDFLYGLGGTDLLFGGAGSDWLEGQAGDDILLGGAGNDTLFGQGGRDILIGGLGSDLLNGGAGDDILIGGTTDHDTNVDALYAIFVEWTSGNSATVRIANLNGTGSGGANGTFLLTTGGTVHSDGAVDRLISGIGFDWLFISLSDRDLALDANVPKDRVDRL